MLLQPAAAIIVHRKIWHAITAAFLRLAVSKCAALSTSSSRAPACGGDWIMTCTQMAEYLVLCFASALAAAAAQRTVGCSEFPGQRDSL